MVRARSRRRCETRRPNGRGWTARHRPPLFNSNSNSICPATDKIPGLPLTVGVGSPVPSWTAIDCWNHPHSTEDQSMIIGERLRALREQKKLSQGDIEKRTGLIRAYVSRVENGHTVPAIETLEKFARALEVPMYQLFHDGEEPPKLPNLAKRKTGSDIAWGTKGEEAKPLAKFCRLFSRMEQDDVELVLFMAQKMA